MDSQHPEGFKKIQALEDRKPTGLGEEPDRVRLIEISQPAMITFFYL